MKKNRVTELMDSPGKLISYGIIITSLCGGIYFVMSFPPRVAQAEQDIVDLKQIIQYYGIKDGYNPEQIQKQPPYLNPPPRQPREPYCEWEDEIEWCWDDSNKEWWRRK